MPVTYTNPNRNTPVTAEVETVNVKLDLTPIQADIDIPKLESLPFGLQSELLMLNSQNTTDEITGIEFVMRSLCVFSRLNPKTEWLDYNMLKNLDFSEAEEPLVEQTRLLAEIRRAAVELLSAVKWGGEGKAKLARKKTKKEVN